MGTSTFGIFDAFPDESGRQAHLSGQVAAELMKKASELLVRCTPENPEAWITLARSIGESADRIRKERLSNAITPAE